MFALLYTFLYINDVKKGIHVLAKPQRSSLRIHLCASERAIFWVFNSFTVKKVNFFTINVKSKVILSSKSGGGGGYLYRPSPHPKKWGGGGGDTSPRDLRQLHHVCAYTFRKDTVLLLGLWMYLNSIPEIRNTTRAPKLAGMLDTIFGHIYHCYLWLRKTIILRKSLVRAQPPL